MAEGRDIHKLLDELVRRERGWLISSLVSYMGPAKVDLAEDVAQDAILKALSSWPYKGIPDNPRAWLRRVAGNAALDMLRRDHRLCEFDEAMLAPASDQAVIAPMMGDPELDLMILCCDPQLSAFDQLALTLKTVCGLTAQDTADLFLLPENTIAQRLARAKRQLRDQAGEVAQHPTRFALQSRLPLLLKTIYLMFAHGYLPRRGEELFRADICKEALRLGEILLAHPTAATPAMQALQALMLFQAARFPARQSEQGQLMTLDDQDRSLWDQKLIRAGFAHLELAQSGGDLSRYHIEAGIASMHARAADWQNTDWEALIRLYTILNELAPSSPAQVNLAVAQMEAGQVATAERTLADLSGNKNVANYPAFHLARARLARKSGELLAAEDHLKLAAACRASAPVQEHIQSELASMLDAPG